MIKGSLTIVFDNPFYKAIFERIDGNNYYVAQVNLGASAPQMPQIWQLVNEKYFQLKFYKTRIENKTKVVHHVNSKRAQRLAQKATKRDKIGTKAQQALKKQFEVEKIAKKKRVQRQKRVRQKERYLQKQTKKRAKHRGH